MITNVLPPFYGSQCIYTVFQKSDAKIEITITIRQIISELNILLAALIIAFLVQTLQISTKSTAQFLSNSCLKNGTQNRSFQYGKVALAVRTQYHQLQFVLKVVAICIACLLCRSFVLCCCRTSCLQTL